MRDMIRRLLVTSRALKCEQQNPTSREVGLAALTDDSRVSSSEWLDGENPLCVSLRLLFGGVAWNTIRATYRLCADRWLS